MNKVQLEQELRYVISGNVNESLKNVNGAVALTEVFIDKISKYTNVKKEDIYKQLELNNGSVQKCTTLNDDVQNCTSHVQNCTTGLGYSKSLNVEVYVEMDKLIREGFSNKVIAEKLGVHRNTISNRRKKLGI